MKDLTEQIYDELNAQVVRMLEHSLNQASRIAELETKLQEQDAMLGRRPCINNRCMDMVSAQSRIADLERQLAEASAPVEFPADGRNDDPAEAAFWSFDARKKGYGRWKGAPQSERDAFKAEYRAAIVAPQAANTDKVREAILALRIVPPRHYDNAQISAFCLGAKTMCEEAAKLTASMAAQAPVREVLGWISVGDRLPEPGCDVLVMSSWGIRTASRHDPKWANGCFQDHVTRNDEGMFAWEVSEGPFSVTHWMPLPAAPAHQEGV